MHALQRISLFNVIEYHVHSLCNLLIRRASNLETKVKCGDTVTDVKICIVIFISTARAIF